MRVHSLLLACSLVFAGCGKSKKKPKGEEAAAIPVSPSRSFRFTAPLRDEGQTIEAPVSLTASDGTGLHLVALDARGVVEDPLAFTELRMTFENPRSETIEGQFRIVLPQDAAVSRFAMKIGEMWQEGEVLEKQAARVAYEDFLHRRQDPALLEQAAGNEFQARVFPIPPNGRKELILSYTHEIDSTSEPYKIPLRGLPQIGEVDVQVLVGRKGKEPKKIEEHFERWVPDRDIVVESQTPDRKGLRAEGVAIVRVTPDIPSERDEFESLLLLVDTSASRALGYSRQTHMVEDLVAALAAGAGSDVPLAVAAFDQETELIFEGKAGNFGQAEARKLSDRKALGASNLHGALSWAKGRSASYARMVVITDGVATAGAMTADDVRKAAKVLGESGVRRIDAIATGGIRDEALLGAMVTSGLTGDGTVIDGDRSLVHITDRLTRRVKSNIQIEVAGASWVWPKRLDAMQAGDQALVYAGLAGDSGIEITVDGAKETPALESVSEAPRPLLHRAAARARIAAMLAERDALPAEDREGRDKLKERIIGLSTRHRVLSPFTALLVLETEHDYRRFGIDRNSLADILTIEGKGIAVVDRTRVDMPGKDRFGRPNSIARGADAPQEEAADMASAEDADEGGTGTKMALDEGKMGRKESTRATGQFAMKAGNADPQLAREQALEQARNSGILGALQQDPAGSVSSGSAASPATERVSEEAPPPPGRAERRPARRRRPPPRPGPRPASPPAEDSREVAADGESEDIDDLLGAPAPQKPAEDPYTGRMAEVMSLLPKQPAQAVQLAWKWRSEEPGDVMALIALGESLEKTGDPENAARAYGSIIDLFAARADLRRFAGERLERIDKDVAKELAVDTFRHAAEQRPDHPSSHRLYAYALLRAGEHEKAFDAMAAGLERSYPGGRFAGARRILSEDLGLIAAAWIREEADKKSDILDRLRKAGGTVEDKPSLRFVLNWETDANDVDFHIYDGKGGHAYYSQKRLPSGGELYADVTTGYGPECFTIRGEPSAYPYVLQAHYYSRGPMGYGMGKLEVIRHDGKGRLEFEQRPFVIMKDRAFIDMGKVTASAKK